MSLINRTTGRTTEESSQTHHVLEGVRSVRWACCRCSVLFPSAVKSELLSVRFSLCVQATRRRRCASAVSWSLWAPTWVWGAAGPTWTLCTTPLTSTSRSWSESCWRPLNPEVHTPSAPHSVFIIITNYGHWSSSSPSSSSVVVSSVLNSTCSDFHYGTALHIAASNLCLGAVKCLLEHGANPTVRVKSLHLTLLLEAV